jgi:hypothetical protein
MLTILNPTQIDKQPKIIVRISKPSDSFYDSEVRIHEEPLARVHLRTPKDVMLIRMMQHGVDYFPPAVGDGLYVKPALLSR